MLHVAWEDGQIAVFGWEHRALSAQRTSSLIARLFGQEFVPVVRLLTIPGRSTPTKVHGVAMSVATASETFLLQTWVPWKSLSASLGWMSKAATFAEALVGRGLVLPSIDPGAGRTHWRPLLDETTTANLVRLAGAMPPVFGAFDPIAPSWQLTSRLVDAFVTESVVARLAGLHLVGSGFPDHRDPRPVAAQARRVFESLAEGTPLIDGRENERTALSLISEHTDRWTAAATGRSPLADVCVFGRLEPMAHDPTESTSSIDDHDPQYVEHHDHNQLGEPRYGVNYNGWTVELFVAPVADHSLYVSAEWLWSNQRSNRRHLPIDEGVARYALGFVRDRLLRLCPILGESFDSEHPTVAKLTVGEVVQILHHELADIREAGLILQVPSWLRSKQRTRTIGRITQTEKAVTPAGLDMKSILRINWVAVLGDESVSEAELRALAEAKSELVVFRGRWVVIGIGEASNTLAAVTRLNRERTVMTAIELVAFSGTLIDESNVNYGSNYPATTGSSNF